MVCTRASAPHCCTSTVRHLQRSHCAPGAAAGGVQQSSRLVRLVWQSTRTCPTMVVCTITLKMDATLGFHGDCAIGFQVCADGVVCFPSTEWAASGVQQSSHSLLGVAFPSHRSTVPAPLQSAAGKLAIIALFQLCLLA